MTDKIENIAENSAESDEAQDYADETEPDVLLDVPQLKVEEVALDVESLRARVSLQAEVLDLLKLGVGVDAELTGVHLEIKGVEAEVLLKARLDTVADIIDRVLTTIDRNPEIVTKATSVVDAAQAGGAETGVTGGAEGAQDLAGEAVKGVGKTVDTSGRLVEGVLSGGGPSQRAAGSRGDPSSEGSGTPRRPKRLQRRAEPPP